MEEQLSLFCLMTFNRTQPNQWVLTISKISCIKLKNVHLFVHKYFKMSYCPYVKSLLGASFEIKSLSFQLVVVQSIFPCYSLVFSETDYYGLRHVHLLFSVQCFLGKLSQEEILMLTDMRILSLFLTSAFKI